MAENPWDTAPVVGNINNNPWDAAPVVGNINGAVSRDAEKVPPSPAFLDRIREGATAFKTHLKESNAAVSAAVTKEFSHGVSEDAIKWLQDQGIITSPGKGGVLRFMNEAIARPAVGLLDLVDRATRAGVKGIGTIIGKDVAAISGDETEGKRAQREAENAMNWALIEFGNVLTRMHVSPAGVAREVPLGSSPFIREFEQAAEVLGDPKSKPLLRKLYDEHGIHPAEVAADALEDVTIVQDLAAGELPGYYVKNPEPKKVAPPAEPPGEPGTALEPRKSTEGGEHDPKAGEHPLPAKTDQPIGFDEAFEQIRSKIRNTEKPEEGMTFDKLYTRFVDDLHPIKVALREAGIEDLPTGENPYELHRLIRGREGKADQMLLNHTYEFNTYAKNGRSLRDVLLPVKDALDDFEVYIVAKRAQELEARGIQSGFGADAPRLVIERLGNRAPEFEKVQRELVDYQNRISLYLRDAGLISQDGYKAMLEANKNYVPFYRFMDPQLFGAKGSGKGLSAQNPFRSIKGDGSDIESPIAAIIHNTRTYIQIAEKNDANLKLIKLLRGDGRAPSKWDFAPKDMQLSLPKPGDEAVIYGGAPGEPTPNSSFSQARVTAETEGTLAREFREAAAANEGTPLKEKPSLPATKDAHVVDAEFEVVFEAYGVKDEGLKQVLSSYAREPSGNEIFAFENGRKITMKVDDPELLQMWRGLDRHSATWLTEVLSKPARLLRAGVTLDPAFSIRNVLMDFYSALVNTKGGIFHPIKTASGAISYVRKDVDFQNWLKGGGANGTMASLDRRYFDTATALLEQQAGFGQGLWNVIKNPLDGLRAYSELLENMTRLGDFKSIVGVKKFGGFDPATSEAGKAAIQAAAMSSREVTLDYARIGAQMRAYNMITAFGNANIQGTDRFIRAAKENPGKTGMVVAGGVMAPTLLLWWANRDDPRYKRLPDWEKDLYWHIMTENTVWRIKKPPIIGVVAGSGLERTLDAYFDGRENDLAAFSANILASLAAPAIPTFVLPLAEQWANKSTLSGSKVVPSYAEQHLPEYQYTPYTTEIAKRLGSILGAFPGMREAATDKANALNGVATALTSPAIMENYLRAWTGGLGNIALSLADTALRKTGYLPDPPKPEDTLADMPFFRSFTVRYPSASSLHTEQFYRMNAQNKQVMATLNTLMQNGDQAAAAYVLKEYGARVTLDKIEQFMGQSAALARRIHQNPEWTPQDKRQMLDTLFMRRYEMAEAGVKMLKEMEKTREAELAITSERGAYQRRYRQEADKRQQPTTREGFQLRYENEARARAGMPPRGGEIKLP